ncbi:MAG TPA: hypothetical protein VIK14_08875, partial [Ignavibacteria bacterium]
LIVAASFSLIGCSSQNNRHIGEWRGTDKGKTGSLILDKTGHAIFVMDNQVFGGNNFEINGVKAELRYEIDYAKEPIWLDLVAFEKGIDAEKGRMKGIIRFLTDTKIEYRLQFDLSAERFKLFDSEDKENTIVLNKITD